MNVEQLMHVHTKIVENFGDEPVFYCFFFLILLIILVDYVVILVDLLLLIVFLSFSSQNIDTVISSYEESCPILIREYGNFASQYTYAIDILDNPKLSKEFVLFCETSRQIPANKVI